MNTPLALYIHFPFCKRKCGYCDFYSVSVFDFARYFDALSREIDTYASAKYRIQSIFVGGGTPSLAPPEMLAGLMTKIRGSFELPASLETTIECNPESVDSAKAARWLEMGFNRASLGVQSFNDDELNLLGRLHNADQARKAFNTLRQAGFKNLSLDLIFGLPGQTADQWKRNIDEGLALAPSHISAYGLSLEPHVPLAATYGTAHLSEETFRERFLFTDTALTKAGYEHYEVSNYAKPGCECQHNLNTWLGGQYIGLGPGAHSYLEGVRYANAKDLQKYLPLSGRRGGPGGEAFEEYRESLSPSQILQESFYLALRTNRGISVNEFDRRFQTGLRRDNTPLLRRLETEGLLEWLPGKDTFRLTAEGYLVSDGIVGEFTV
jgi:oxygen-independent coproporphyrinogen III oxidase